MSFVRPSFSTVALICFAAVVFCGSPQSVSAQADENRSERSFALLIGINRYPTLGAKDQLKGCVNDVRLMRSLLTNHAEFARESIVTLTDAEATHDAIMASLDDLRGQVERCNEAGRGARVVLHFSGHGSQVMDQFEGPLRDEPSFYDQTLVPSDAEKLGGQSDIRDDELRDWANTITRDRRNRLFVVLDCCHSGTGLRSLQRYRRLDRPLPNPNPNRFSPIAEAAPLPENAVVISACRSDQLEPEFEKDGEPFGLLTYWLCQLASKEVAVRHSELSELPGKLQTLYRESAGVAVPPEPQIEWSARISTESLLFVRPETERHLVAAVANRNGTVAIEAGLLASVTVGTRYPIFDFDDLAGETAVGEIEIINVGVDSSTGVLRGADPSNIMSEPRLWCEIKPSAGSEAPLAISLSNSQGDSAEQILQRFGWLKHPGIRYVSEAQKAGFRLSFDDRQLVLHQLIGQTRIRCVGFSLDGQLQFNVERMLKRLVLSQRFVSLVSGQRGAIENNDGLQVDLVRGGIVHGQYQFSAVSTGPGQTAALRTGDVYALRIRHPRAQSVPLYASVIHIDPAFDVAAMCPTEFTTDQIDQQSIPMPQGLTTRSFVCNGDSMLPANHPNYEQPRIGLNRAVVIVSEQVPNLSQLFRIMESAGGTKSLGDSATKMKLEFGYEQRGKKSLTAEGGSGEPWWTAKVIRWKNE